MAVEKERLDIILVEKGFFPTREKAKQNIMAGLVFVDNKRVDKAGEMIKYSSSIEIKGNTIPYVSRGGLKLEKAIKTFNIDVLGKDAIDVGASTGGFTDCLLQNGAKSVTAIDVGYGQFAWELRNDERVKLMERTNIRYVTLDNIGKARDIAVIDVSFISLKLVLPVVKKLIIDSGEIVCLIKPQFEAGRDRVGKKGVVRDPKTHMDVIKEVIKFSEDINLCVKNLSFSPIKGPEGNIEYILYLINNKDTEYNQHDIEDIIAKTVEESHKSL